MKGEALEANICEGWLNLLNKCETAEQLLKSKNFPEILCGYVIYVRKVRVPKFEEIIGSDPKCAFYYARDVVKGRILKFEEVIGSDPEYAFYYAKEVVKGRIPEFETTIRRNEVWYNCYSKYVISTCK